MAETALYLIPVPLGDGDLSQMLPPMNIALVGEIKHFIVENVRSARRFLKKCDCNIDIDSLTFYELIRHTDPRDVDAYLNPLVTCHAMGVISEAGCPAIADPGADVVAIAQRKKLKVRPLVGPSSILLGLMGSGFNGQSFAFLGYLPIDPSYRTRKLKEMEQRIMRENQSQIFIETPYRNNQLLAELVKTLPTNLKLCVATDLTGKQEKMITQSIKEWSKTSIDLHKVPTIFLLYK